MAATPSPSLRVELRETGSHLEVALVDAVSSVEMILAQDVEASHIDAINEYLWRELDLLGRGIATDPALELGYARRVASRLYRIGYSALLDLLRHAPGATPDAVHAFCAERTDQAEPPIVDVVSEPKYRLLIEPLPLFGKAAFTSDDSGVELDVLARVIAGLRAIVRHRRLGEAPPGETAMEVEVPVPVRYFRHSELESSNRTLRHLRDLEKQGKTRVVLEFPHRGFSPLEDWPELQLGRVLADPRGSKEGRRGPDALICHFNCHQRRHEGKQYLELKADGWRPRPARYRPDQIRVGIDHADRHPPEPKLCFICACRSAAVDRDSLVSAVEAFDLLAPRSVVGTLGSVPDRMASELTRHFYSALAEGAPVGAALRLARTALLAPPLRNPLGLLFVSRFGEDVSFVTRAIRRSRLIPHGRQTMVNRI